MDDSGKDDLLAVVHGRRAVYDFLAQLFLHPIPTPGQDYASRVLRAIDAYPCVSDLEDFHAGIGALATYKAMTAGRDLDDVQKELAVDRTRLCRGSASNNVVAPPYEAPYLSPERETDRLLAIVQFYRKTGLTMSADQRERMDYIGIELAFMAELCGKESAALVAENVNDYEAVLAWEQDFLRQHLLQWAVDYCGKMIDYAETEFFRGIGYLMRAFLQEERELCEPA